MSSAFDGPIVHVGGDETEEQGSCNKQNIRDLASAMQDHVSGTLNKIPMVWNEVHTVLGGARPETIVQCWNNCNVADIASAGNKVVYSFMHDFFRLCFEDVHLARFPSWSMLVDRHLNIIL